MARILLGIYIHIPYCDVKCAYCDFYSLAQRHVDNHFWKLYLQKIKEDFEKKSAFILENYRLASIFFGGGTPTKAPGFFFEEIIDYIINKFSHRKWKHIEISAEANPESFNQEKAKMLYLAGINRINFGIQTREKKLLHYLGRIYQKKSYQNCIAMAHQTGFKRVGADFIFGIPGQSLNSLKKDLTWAIEEGVNHLSLYSLTIEKGTKLYQEILKQKKKKPSSLRQLYHYQKAQEFLASAGFYQYEISNYARVGFACLHNLLYWKYRPYLGLGVSSHSFLGNYRLIEKRSLYSYLNGEGFQIVKANHGLEYFIGTTRISLPQSLHHFRRFLPEKEGLLQEKLNHLAKNKKIVFLAKNLFFIEQKELIFADNLLEKLAFH